MEPLLRTLIEPRRSVKVECWAAHTDVYLIDGTDGLFRHFYTLPATRIGMVAKSLWFTAVDIEPTRAILRS